jgi:hypothetical protein
MPGIDNSDTVAADGVGARSQTVVSNRSSGIRDC